ncbi:hypothetical protein DIPPA_03157 [Diplonema papillatum]|nr:hypothetical protein DIPPA_03157 [Diplonema papillatum]
MACLQPSISATDVPGVLMYLGGSPADTIGFLDLATQTTTKAYTGSANQVGKTGIGPIIFVEPGTTPIPTTMIPATMAPPTPLPLTDAPPTHPPETSIPLTSIPPTHPPETEAPKTYVPTEAPLDCSIYLNPAKCKSITRLCEWNYDSRVCVLFGSRCSNNDEQSCVEIANCVWNEGDCLPADDCANQLRPDCIALSQCVWTNEIDGCMMANSAEEEGTSARVSLVVVIVLAFVGFCGCAVCLAVFVYLIRKSARKTAAIESARRAVASDEEQFSNNDTPTNAEKIRRVGDLREEMLLTQEVVGSPTTISRNAFQTPNGSDRDENDSSADELTAFLEENLADDHVVDGAPSSVYHNKDVLDGDILSDPTLRSNREKELMHKIAEARHNVKECTVQLAEKIKTDTMAHHRRASRGEGARVGSAALVSKHEDTSPGSPPLRPGSLNNSTSKQSPLHLGGNGSFTPASAALKQHGSGQQPPHAEHLGGGGYVALAPETPATPGTRPFPGPEPPKRGGGKVHNVLARPSPVMAAAKDPHARHQSVHTLEELSADSDIAFHALPDVDPPASSDKKKRSSTRSS